MNVQSRTRTLATAALVALLAASFGAAAAPEPRENPRQEHRDDRTDRQDQRKERRAERKEQKKERRQERRAERRDDRQERRVERRVERRDDRQDRRVERRVERRDDRRDDRQRQQAVQRHYQQRLAQQRYQAQYQRELRAQQARLNALRYDYRSNPYRHLPASYRYSYGGNWYSTNRYGADMLRDAVRRGYQEGLRAGRADRYDRWSNGYRDSRAWIDASYGYDNYYVRRADYQHYFRQGFERGYQDGYHSRQRYGRYNDNDNTAIIFTAVLATILGMQSIN